MVTDVIKDDDVSMNIEETDLFAVKSEKLGRTLELMEPKDKMILLMKYQDDISIKEIKESLAIGESAVKMRIKRARHKAVSIYSELLEEVV